MVHAVRSYIGHRLGGGRDGQTMVEYAGLVSLLAVMALAGVFFLGPMISGGVDQARQAVLGSRSAAGQGTSASVSEYRPAASAAPIQQVIAPAAHDCDGSEELSRGFWPWGCRHL